MYGHLGLKEERRAKRHGRLKRSAHGGCNQSSKRQRRLVKCLGILSLTSPTARNLPFGLIETLVTALILSLDDHARGLPLSEVSPEGDAGRLRCGLERIWERERDLGSGVAGGVE